MSKRSKAPSLKGATALSSIKATVAKLSQAEVEPNPNVLQAGPLVPETSNIDPLEAIVAFPGNTSGISANFASSDLDPSNTAPVELHSSGRADRAPTPWDYPANLFSLVEANATCISGFAKQLAAAKTPQELLVATSELYAEQGQLLKQHTTDLLKMMYFKRD